MHAGVLRCTCRAAAALADEAAALPCRFHRLSQLCGDAPDTSQLATHFERFLQLRDVFCIKEFLSGW